MEDQPSLAASLHELFEDRFSDCVSDELCLNPSVNSLVGVSGEVSAGVDFDSRLSCLKHGSTFRGDPFDDFVRGHAD